MSHVRMIQCRMLIRHSCFQSWTLMLSITQRLSIAREWTTLQASYCKFTETKNLHLKRCSRLQWSRTWQVCSTKICHSSNFTFRNLTGCWLLWTQSWRPTTTLRILHRHSTVQVGSSLSSLISWSLIRALICKSIAHCCNYGITSLCLVGRQSLNSGFLSMCRVQMNSWIKVSKRLSSTSLTAPRTRFWSKKATHR